MESLAGQGEQARVIAKGSFVCVQLGLHDLRTSA